MEKAPQRLKRRREFLQIARAGRKWAAPGLVLQVLDRHSVTNTNASEHAKKRPDSRTSSSGAVDEALVRVGFTVTRKIGGAVIRNRAKRRLRAAAETVMPTHAAPGRDYVVIGRAKTNARPFSDLVGDLETALRKLNAWHDVATTTNGPGDDKEHRNG
ncbi:MAG: ribonuclease P protein component [Proteobacteria bacterium]|nr:ribonuclease P protein component [Pseudomonadota bacterium]MDA1323620.1 ribonuclease P protein component [Pseudomonadota bacterium]